MKRDCNKLSIGAPGTLHIAWEPAHEFIVRMKKSPSASFLCCSPSSQRQPTPAARTRPGSSIVRAALGLLLIATAISIFAPTPCRASLVVISYTNSSTGLRDTNDFRTIPLSNVQNADGSFNTIGPAVRYKNTNGIVTNYYVANNYLLTNNATGFWQLFRVTDSSSNVVTLGQISLGQNANPFVKIGRAHV